MIVMMMACVMVIWKKIRIQIYKNAKFGVLQKDSKLVPKKFMCGRCDSGLGGVVFFITKKLQS